MKPSSTGVSRKSCRETYKASRHNPLNTLIMNTIKDTKTVQGGGDGIIHVSQG